jgi:hypothetical protein
MVHQPLVSFLVGFESVDTFFKTGKKSRSGPLAIGVGFLRGNNKAVCWPALAHDLSNRIIDIHHGVHGGKLSPFGALGKRQGKVTRACLSGTLGILIMFLALFEIDRATGFLHNLQPACPPLPFYRSGYAGISLF